MKQAQSIRKPTRRATRNRPPEQLVTRVVNTVPNSWNDERRSVCVVAATEDQVRVWDWDRYGAVYEVLLMDGVMLPENNQVPLLDSHSRYSVKEVLRGAKGFEPNMMFSETEEGERAATKMKEGHLTDRSVGYDPIDSVWVPEGETAVISSREFTIPLKVTRTRSSANGGSRSSASRRSERTSRQKLGPKHIAFRNPSARRHSG